MAKLRLANPKVSRPREADLELVEVDVAVDVPVPHLDGEYSYLAPKASISLGSLVRIPFGTGETFGFVTRIKPWGGSSKFKHVTSVLIPQRLFDEAALLRYRSIVDRYGGSLISLLKIAIPMRRASSIKFIAPTKDQAAIRPSIQDQKFLSKYFGDLDFVQGEDLLLPPGMLWDRVAISIFLADPVRTAIMVPTERDLKYLERSLRERGVEDFHILTSTLRSSERSREFFGVLNSSTPLVIGTRSIAYAPTSFERVIIIDPGHFSYQEPRVPHFRSDDPFLWNSSQITISHTRELSKIAASVLYRRGAPQTICSFLETNAQRLITDLQRVLRTKKGARSVLISLNDRSFASGLRCAQCKNRSSCDCGFPLAILERNGVPSCTKCGLRHENYRCNYCHSQSLQALRAGNQSWALSIAKSIKGARVLLSDSSNDKNDVVLKEDEITVIIATQGFEPRIYGQDGRYQGYDVIALMGGFAGFNSSSLAKSDQYRRAWTRTLGLARSRKADVLLELERSHVEFSEIVEPRENQGIENLLAERKSLFLPPYSILVEVTGESSALVRLRAALLQDRLFQTPGASIYPVQGERFVIKVGTSARDELLRLMLNMAKLRSAKRLSPIRYRIASEYL